MECPICRNNSFHQTEVMKKRLIEEWALNPDEVTYINRQQGFYCTSCGSNLRSMTLADSIMKQFDFQDVFKNFPKSKIGRKLKLLEINEACGLHPFLTSFKKYKFANYPDIDIQNLPFEDSTFDIIIHSDTLEHVQNSLLGLQECFRLLKDGGKLFYTIPIIYGRLTKKRDGLPASYHGTQEENQGEDFKVWTEYGADFWVEIIKAGFKEVTLNTLKDLSSLGICAKKLVVIR